MLYRFVMGLGEVEDTIQAIICPNSWATTEEGRHLRASSKFEHNYVLQLAERHQSYPSRMSSSKAKAKGVSASSFFDLKAELSRQELEFARAKVEGKSLAVVGGIKRPDKKPTVWARQNKGVKARANRDVELEEISKPTLDSARAALERKAQIYEKLRRGKTGGLNDAQYDALLVDFDSNPSTSKYYQGHSSDEDESSTVPKAPTSYENDPIVEYEDEFGRIRSARRSEVPRNLVLDQDEQEDDEDLIRNPVNHFPTYQPSEDRVAEIEKAYAEENNPLNVHYDASREVRAKGAAFYQFSGDEETRRQQMEEMKASREETERMRRNLGSEDVKPGEVEGMQDDSGNTGEGVARSRAMEKRKREIEERRKLLDAKRRKLKKSDTPEASNPPTSTPTTMATTTTASGEERGKTTSSVSDDPSATLDNASKAQHPNADPFAALESQTSKESKGKQKAQPASSEADSFLAQLEGEFLASRTKK
ncbi:unnamed protein product [Cyclocybe aegerita]|uniref:Uncharacterized protein n=1 Tax=Cyclocybe aegerita TaxID=1973307 RepID=A0A8S0WP52_CYCAE|nr:unnamed protein product [Cyclocybe aegerita]